jgi:methyl-accepting chemotaxis protein
MTIHFGVRVSDVTTTRTMKMKNLKARILTPFRWVVGVVTLAFCFLWIAQTLIANKTLMQQMTQKFSAIGLNFQEMVTSLEMNVKQLSINNEVLWNAIHEQDQATIDETLTWMVKTQKYGGYILVDNDNSVITSTFDNLVQSELEEIISSKESTDIIGGCGSFVEGLICEYKCGPVADEAENVLGQIFLVGFIATDNATLMGLKQQQDVDIFIFSGDSCLLNTADIPNEIITPHSEASDSCLLKNSIWIGESEFNGKDFLTTYMPLIDYKGKAKGMLCMSLPETLVEELVESILFVCIITWVIILALYFILAYRIRTKLISSVEVLSERVSVIAEGDLTTEIEENTYAQEIHQLSSDVREMQNKIREMVLPIAKASEALVGSMQQLSGASMQMSNAANRQAASLEEISSSMEEMGANIQQNTENSMHTNKIAENISSMIGEMGSAATESYEAISNIANDVQAINELVSQTNILALNASVEAARAGEQGKGFGVVAKEVGRLADQTHVTANGINDTASSSIAQAENAHKLVMELLPKIEQVATLIKEITAASVEQNAGVNQVNSAIMDLNRVTQENAAAAEEVAASAQDIQRMLLDVKNALTIFKI